MKRLGRAAIWYRRNLDASVIPLGPRGKRPLRDALPGGEWRPYQQHKAPEQQVKTWWTRWPAANIGLVSGAVSGFLVLDVDGPRGADSLRELVADHGPLPDTVEQLTGGGGRHIFFKHPGGSIQNAVALMPGLDIRADGGYVVAPPSIHPSGRRYEWEASSRPDEVKLAPAPAWLLDKLQRPVEGQARPPEWWRELVGSGAAEGERNNTVARLAGYLLRRRVDPFVVLELVLAWNGAACTPPLPEKEIRRTVNSIAGAELRRRRGGGRRGA